MKGVVFTELLEMVENQYSMDFVDQILDECDLPSGGSYTAVGTYDHEEWMQLVQQLSQKTDTPVADSLKTFGQYLFGRFAANYGQFFVGIQSAFDFLKGIEDYIHVEVRKLYSDAELPHFEWEQPAPDQLLLVYRSKRPLADLAEGLINGCLKYFGETCDLQREDLPDEKATRFHLKKQT